MISKQFRLREREVKKVLRKGKPFFSYSIVLNYTKNRLNYPRFAVVIGAKSVNTNVTRNFFRRRFYDTMQANVLNTHPGFSFDLVFVVKKQTKLDRKDEKVLQEFKNNLEFLIKKIIK